MKDNKENIFLLKVMEKKKILIAILILLIIIEALIITKEFLNLNNSNNEINIKNQKEEFVDETTFPGVKLNISPRINEIKIFDELEISDIQITTKDNVGSFIANVTNKTNDIKGDYAIGIIIYDKNDNEITTVHGYIKSLKPRETTQLSASKTFDFSNAYEVKFEKE